MPKIRRMEGLKFLRSSLLDFIKFVDADGPPGKVGSNPTTLNELVQACPK